MTEQLNNQWTADQRTNGVERDEKEKRKGSGKILKRFVVYQDGERRGLQDTDLVGDVEGFLVGGEADERLLEAVGADEGVDLCNIDVVHGLDGVCDLGLGCAARNDKDEGVVVLNVLHGGFGGERESQNRELVGLLRRNSRPAEVLGRSVKGKRRRTAERNLGQNLLRRGLHALLHGLCGSLGLCGSGVLGSHSEFSSTRPVSMKTQKEKE